MLIEALFYRIIARQAGQVSSIYSGILFAYIAIHRRLHTVLRRLVVQPRTVFGGAPGMRLYEYRWGGQYRRALCGEQELSFSIGWI